jgi:tetrapyrrole methylase family protein/MazG family protein
MNDPKQCLKMDPRSFDTLLAVMAALRSPEGCPWDKKQTHESLKRYLLEETYEVIDAIDQNDRDNLVEELGDLLFQIVFHAQIGEEDGAFSTGDIIEGITTKMISRHPHVFGDLSPEEVDWEAQKSREKHTHGLAEELHRIPQSFTALMAAEKTLKKMAKAGLWTKKPADDLTQIKKACEAYETGETKAGAICDMLTAAVDLARANGIQPELLLKSWADAQAEQAENPKKH